jgi:CRISPR-associated protein Cmr5
MKQRIERYIPEAIKLISTVEIADRNGIIANEFNGYFSSFGAAIVQSGLKPALAFFSNENSEVAANRAKILIAIYKLVVNNGHDDPIKARALLDHVLQPGIDEEKIKAEIIDASVALKLAVRTYKLVKS